MTRPREVFFPLLLIFIGVLLLLGNLGVIHDLGEMLADWWPLVIVLLGAWILHRDRREPVVEQDERLSIERGEVERASIHIEFGAGILRVGPAPAGRLLEGEFVGGVRHEVRPGGWVELEPDHSRWWRFYEWRGFRWNVGLTTEVPLELRVDSGAADCTFDLTETRLVDLDVQTGASQTTIHMPRSAGQTRARVEAGAASTTVHIPPGVAARITVEMGLGSKDIDMARFPKSGGAWESPDYATNPNRIDLRFEGGIGAVRVT